MANFSWDRWTLYGSGWTTSYYGTGTVTCTRASGSDTANVQATTYMWCYGGDTVNWTMHMKVGNTEYTASIPTINGVHVADGGAYSNSTYYYATFNKNISVGVSSGTLTVKFWMTIDSYEAYTGGTSATKTVSLSYGSKGASTITTASNRTLGQACSIKWTPNSADFKYRLRFVLGDWYHATGFITPNTTSAYTYTGYTLPLTAPASGVDLLTQIPNSNTATMTVKLYTYDANENLLGNSSKTFTVTVPSDVSTVPTISSVSLSGQDSSFTEYCVSLSKMTIAVATAGTRGSTVQNAVVTVGNDSYPVSVINNACTVTTPELIVSGAVAVVVTITDSRGLTATTSQNVTVYDYAPPRSTSFAYTISGTTVTLTIEATYSDVNSKNTGRYYRVIRKKLSDSTTSDAKTKTAVSGYTLSTTITQTVADIDTESYEYTLYLYDTKYSTDGTAITSVITTGIVCISRLAGGKGVAFFREAEATDEGKVAINGDIEVAKDANKTEITPIGIKTNNRSYNVSYASEDTLTGMFVTGYGYISNNSKTMWLHFPFSRHIDATKFNFTSLDNCYVRTSIGGYVYYNSGSARTQLMQKKLMYNSITPYVDREQGLRFAVVCNNTWASDSAGTTITNNSLIYINGLLSGSFANYIYTQMTPSATSVGWKLTGDGLCITDSNYKLIKFTVTAGNIVKVVSDHMYQFQTIANVPASGTPNTVGPVYGIGEYVVTVPDGATYVILSTLQDGSSAKVYSTS